MRLFTLLSTALFTLATLASPFRQSNLNHQILRRTPLVYHGRPLHKSNTFAGNNTKAVIYSSNWAGAILESPPPNTTFTSVSASFTVPKPSVPDVISAAGFYAASIWVGIDGDTAHNSILQAGVDLIISKSGNQNIISYSAWHEWYPKASINFDSSLFNFTAGDVISISISSSSPTQGFVVLENLTTGSSIETSLTSPCPACSLAGQNAEWIVEDFSSGGSQVPFADFGTVVFEKVRAGVSDGRVLGAEGAVVVEIMNSTRTILTDVRVLNGSSVEVVYI